LVSGSAAAEAEAAVAVAHDASTREESHSTCSNPDIAPAEKERTLAGPNHFIRRCISFAPNCIGNNSIEERCGEGY
jgi:hypothetical protein